MGSGGSFLNENTPLSESWRPAEARDDAVWRETLTLLEEGEGGGEEELQERSVLPIVS